MSKVSPNVVIMTKDELRARENAAFQRGVARGKFEAATPSLRVSRNCANYHDGICNVCGAQWQGCEVGPDYRCPQFTPRKDQPNAE